VTEPAFVTLVQLAQWAGGDLHVRDVPEGAAAREALLRSGVRGATLDTRELGPGMLFVPLAGSRTDGHAFLDEAFARGAGAALCARAVHARIAHLPLGPLVLVDDVTAALQKLAAEFRKRWPGWLVAVTGSAGKTTTKELVAAVLGTAGPVLRTEGNLNNHWGVPLTLLGLSGAHHAAVVEMGMNHAGEIAALAALARPDACVVTNAGSAHLENLGSLEAIATEKASLARALRAGAPAFIGADSPRLVAAVKGIAARVVTYGLAPGADVRPTKVEDLGDAGTRFEVPGFPPVQLRLIGLHQVANALAALAVARERRLDPEAVVAALAAHPPLEGRMQVQHAAGATLLVDHYNANPDSMRAALATLERWPRARRRIAVLGDMKELGETAAALHREVGEAVRGAELWAVGAHAADYAAGARAGGAQVRTFPDKPAVAAALRGELGPGVVVLFKASRGAALEDVLAGLPVEAGAEAGT
jgi:UDP-N-acetylmuramoyl-tripeptide--D-alanyl-D-alanine ligase